MDMKNHKNIISLVISVVVIVGIFIYNKYLFYKFKDGIVDAEFSDIDNWKIKDGCDHIVRGMTVDEVSEIFKEVNRRTRTVDKNSEVIRYWVADDPAKYMPSGYVCRIEYGVDMKVKNASGSRVDDVTKSETGSE
jgi:hypothetical protein